MINFMFMSNWWINHATVIYIYFRIQLVWCSIYLLRFQISLLIIINNMTVLGPCSFRHWRRSRWRMFYCSMWMEMFWNGCRRWWKHFDDATFHCLFGLKLLVYTCPGTDDAVYSSCVFNISSFSMQNEICCAPSSHTCHHTSPLKTFDATNSRAHKWLFRWLFSRLID